MKKPILILCLLFFFSCKKESQNQPKQEAKPVLTEKASVQDSLFTSIIRPGEKLKLEQMMTDDFEFTGYNDNGDYLYIYTKKDNQEMALIYDWEKTPEYEFNRGDIIRIDWQIDSVFVAGDGESLHFEEWAKKARKIKDGKVSLFRKKYKKLKYHYSKEYSSDYLDEIYRLVEYYLANSKKDLVVSNLSDPNIDIEYSIEERTENGKDYIVIGISAVLEDHSSIMQWLYIENREKTIIYEYDLGNEKLIPFD